jgi:hypothetical protein
MTKEIAHLKETMKPSVSLFNLLRSANKAFSAWMVSISTNVATNLALGGVIPWATVYIDLESNLLS